jgi:hypothetical protein
MGQVFGDNTGITHVEDSRVVWSTSRRPALLLPDDAVTLTGFDIAYPDVSKSDAYGFTFFTDPTFGTTQSACASWTSVNPQEWDSGLSFVCNLPSGSNYFEVEMTMSRIFTPSTWLGTGAPIPILLGSGVNMPDGNSAVIEGIGPLVRMFSFERSGNAVYLRRKTSINNPGGPVVSWNSGNNNDNGSGGMRRGFTYGGDPNAWPSYLIDQRTGGDIQKRRGGSNQCSLSDPTNYASTYRGTVIITPGYIQL